MHCPVGIPEKDVHQVGREHLPLVAKELEVLAPKLHGDSAFDELCTPVKARTNLVVESILPAEIAGEAACDRYCESLSYGQPDDI